MPGAALNFPFFTYNKMRLLHEVAEYVEGFGDKGIVGSAVDERRARGGEEGEVDVVGGIVFLVMAH